MKQPLVVCLCPTYRRKPELLANAIACFEAQTYPLSRRKLIVLDDAGELRNTLAYSRGWRIASMAERFSSLPAKYNHLAMLGDRADICVVWEDDDIYLPWHLTAVVASMNPRVHHGIIRDVDTPGPQWAHPSCVWSLYGGELHQEGAAGRFHASLAFRREALAKVGGWPETPRADFDQQLIGKLRGLGPPGDPCDNYPPSYVFRYGSTGDYHGQHVMRGGDDTGWYDRIPERARAVERGLVIEPKLDAETRALFEKLEGDIDAD
jgi:hypothetical protein